MSHKKKPRFNRPPKKKEIGPSNSKTGLIFVVAIVVVMFGLLGLYLANQF